MRNNSFRRIFFQPFHDSFYAECVLWGISDFRISSQSLIKKNCHNSRTSNDIDMKLGPVPILKRETRQHQKNLTMMSCRQIVTSLSLFRFMANLQQSGSRISNAWSVKLTFSLMVTFYLTKRENRTKKSLPQLSYYCFE